MIRRFLSVFMAVALVFMVPMAPHQAAHAKLTAVPTIQVTDQWVSAADTSRVAEWLSVTAPGNYTVRVEGKVSLTTKRLCVRIKKHKASSYAITAFITPNKSGEFAMLINTRKGNAEAPQVVDGKGTVAQADECYGTKPGYDSVDAIPVGTYHLTVARASTAADANLSSGWFNGPLGGGDGCYAWKETLLCVNTANNFRAVSYPKAEANNASVRASVEKSASHVSTYKGSYVRYQDTYLTDLSWYLRDPVTGKQASMTAAKVNYLKKVVNNVAPAGLSKYERLQRIYEYVAGNFYYDKLAHSKGTRQYADPYLNIYQERTNTVTKPNAVKGSGRGKVAVTCQGYATMVVALARAAGIPARMVQGCHISLPLSIWSDKANAFVGTNTHWWMEAYIDGRWVVVDADAGSWNTWERGSFSAKGTWTKKAFGTYVGFDPSEQQLSMAYSYNSIYPGSTNPKFMNRTDETQALRRFLDTKVSGKTNGKRLNVNYSASNFATWGTTAAKDLLTDGHGRIERVDWNRKAIYGNLDLSTCKKLTFANLYGTSLYSFGYWNGSKKVTFKRNNANGFVGVVYDKGDAKKVTLYGKPKAGYKCTGIYNAATGKRVSAASKYTFNPTAATYVVKFAKK